MNDIVVKYIKKHKSPGLYIVETDDGQSVLLTAKGIFENGIKTEKVFTQRQFDKIREYSEREHSYRYAVFLLGRRDYSSGEMLKKLSEKGDFAQETVERLVKSGYIDDDNYSRKIIDKYIDKYGKKRIEEELYKRFIPREVWRGYLDACCEDMSEQVLKLLSAKMKNRPFTDRSQRDKTYAYFIRRGYDFESISKAFRRYGDNGEFDD